MTSRSGSYKNDVEFERLWQYCKSGYWALMQSIEKLNSQQNKDNKETLANSQQPAVNRFNKVSKPQIKWKDLPDTAQRVANCFYTSSFSSPLFPELLDQARLALFLRQTLPSAPSHRPFRFLHDPTTCLKAVADTLFSSIGEEKGNTRSWTQRTFLLDHVLPQALREILFFGMDSSTTLTERVDTFVPAENLAYRTSERWTEWLKLTPPATPIPMSMSLASIDSELRQHWTRQMGRVIRRLDEVVEHLSILSEAAQEEREDKEVEEEEAEEEPEEEETKDAIVAESAFVKSKKSRQTQKQVKQVKDNDEDESESEESAHEEEAILESLRKRDKNLISQVSHELDDKEDVPRPAVERKHQEEEEEKQTRKKSNPKEFAVPLEVVSSLSSSQLPVSSVMRSEKKKTKSTTKPTNSTTTTKKNNEAKPTTTTKKKKKAKLEENKAKTPQKKDPNRRNKDQ